MKKFVLIIMILLNLCSTTLFSTDIRNPEGLKLYSYIVLLYYENVHFVNKIEKEKITVNELFQNETVNHTRYISYMNSLGDKRIKSLAQEMFDYYKDRNSFTAEKLDVLEKSLENENILVKFNVNNRSEHYIDYLLFGKLEKLSVKSPLFKDVEDYYNIIPYLPYDDLRTSSTTFYPNLIHINMNEMYYDHKIFLDILSGKNSIPLYLGVPIDDNIRSAVKKAYPDKKCTVSDVRILMENMILTMQIAREKLKIKEPPVTRGFGLSSVIYDSPYEGLILLYAYLQYDKKTEYSKAANNFIKFTSDKTGNDSIKKDPSLLCSMTKDDLAKIAHEYYLYLLKERELY